MWSLETDYYKKAGFFKEKISESSCKPKELRESLKYLGMPNQTLISNFRATLKKVRHLL